MAAAPLQPTVRGQWMEVTIKIRKDTDGPGFLLPWDDGYEALKSFKPPGKTETYVESVIGKAYSICLRNTTNHTLTYKLFIDGVFLDNYYILPGLVNDHANMVTSRTMVDGNVNEVRSELVFKQPSMAQEDVPLYRAVAAGSAEDRLGKIEIKVYEAIEVEEYIPNRNVVDLKTLEAPVGAADGQKKSAFKMTTGRGAKTDFEYHASTRTSKHRVGPNLLETLTVRYASRAMLLLMGVPPHLFMDAKQLNYQQKQDQKVIDLTRDDPPKKRARAAHLRTGARGAASSSSAGGDNDQEEVECVKREVDPLPVISLDDSDNEAS